MNVKHFSILFVLLGLMNQVNYAVAGDEPELFAEREVSFSDAIAQVNKATAVLDEYADSVPEALRKKAQAMVIIPNMFKAALVGIGASLGRGVAVVRDDNNEWSSPSLVSLSGGSVGIQLGAQSADLILLFRNRQGVEDLEHAQMKMAADAGVAAGPVGRTAELGMDLEFKSPVYSYSHSKGLFAGVSLSGQMLEVDKAGNKGLYGQEVKSTDIFAGKVTTDAEAVKILKERLKEKTEALEATTKDDDGSKE